MNTVLSHNCTCSYQGHLLQGRFDSVPSSMYFGVPVRRVILLQCQYLAVCYRRSTRKYRTPFCSTTDGGTNSDDSKDENEGKDPPNDENKGKGTPSDENEGSKSSNDKTSEVDSVQLRENLEKTVGRDDSAFNGLDLATLIRKKYGRSYDVQLIKKEFMGRNLLAMNVMWKYVEQRSFPLTEEEYIVRLDDVANALKCWGAVQHIRNSLERSKERPRIGKAVCIFIDMDLKGGRANEWIYK